MHFGREVPVFHPSLEEFQDFAGYIRHIEEICGTDVALAKVVPPPEWCARRDKYKDVEENLSVETPTQQIFIGNRGIYQMMLVQQKGMSLKEFKELAMSDQHKPSTDDPESLERKFWKSVAWNPPLYGSDFMGTLFDHQAPWNLSNLDTILSRKFPYPIPGVNRPYLYIGMNRAAFGWHKEDKDLYSINYIHFGKPKIWYAIPPSQAKRFEQIAQGYFPDEKKACEEYLRHKTTLISPNILKMYNIPIISTVHNEGEFMITFPSAYHAGFNLGYNCAEAVNFASERWIPIGFEAKHCQCSLGGSSVNLDMNIFLEKEHHCFCEMPRSGLMVACDRCEEWYHADCVKFSSSQKHFICPNCSPSWSQRKLVAHIQEDGKLRKIPITFKYPTFQMATHDISKEKKRRQKNQKKF